MRTVDGSLGPWLAAFAVAFGLVPRPVLADASAWSDTDHTQVRLVSATTAVGGAKELSLGLHFRLEKGWKIYWRSPGDAGFPPAADWTGSQNLGAVEFRWPAPERFSVLGFETVGYKDEVVLPLRVTLAQPGQPLALRANISFLTCDEICVPYDAPLALDIAAGAAEPAAEAHLIDRFAAGVPGNGRDQGLVLAGAAVEDSPGGPVLRLAARLSPEVGGGFAKPDAFVEGPDDVDFGRPRIQLAEAGELALLELPISGLKDSGKTLIGEPLTVTVVDGQRSAEWSVRPAAALPAGIEAAAGAGSPGIWVVLGLAVLGGLILNLMPCVLPVLSIKLLSVVSHGGGERRAVRRGFLASAAGIMTTFLALAGTIVALKAAGTTIGWGIQFQHPWFLVALTGMVSLFAANLWGVFEIPLPRALADVLGDHRQGKGLAGHFIGGAFATLLATPCSAPFLGTAVGFALARGPAEILAVFAALGLGLALPYLAVAAVPAMVGRMPRPGPWMATLRRVLGLVLAATAVWLLTVIAAQSGASAAAAVAVVMVLLVAVPFLARRRPAGQRRWAMAVAAGLMLAALGMPTWFGGDIGTGARRPLGGVWRPFDEAAIGGLVEKGQTVFVDVTADWCITCQVNKAAVLERGAVHDRLSATGLVAMQADWTRPDAAIARYLARFGRYGIPFNVVYGPKAPQGIPLPELLTASDVLATLDAAGAVAATAAR